MIQKRQVLLVAMFQVLLSHLSRIQCWCHDLHLSQRSSQCHGSPPPAITCKHQTDTNTQPPHMSPSLHNNNLVQSMVTKRYTGGRMHGMFQGFGWFCVSKISETMATACAAATPRPALTTGYYCSSVANLAPLSVTSQLLWPTATMNYGGRRPQIGSL